MYKVLKNIVASATVLTGVAFTIYRFFSGGSSSYENMILSLLILISTTYLLENIDNNNKWKKMNEDIKNIVHNIAECKISVFENSNDWIDAMDKIIENGKHSVDTVSLDSSTRTKVKRKHDKIWNHIKGLAENPNIKFRHVIRVRKNNYENLLDRIISGNSKNDSYYAYYFLPEKLPFATFGIIDNKYISSRSPYENGETPRYLIIESKELSDYYISWFNHLWIDSNKITSSKCLNEIYENFSDEFSEPERVRIEEKIAIIDSNGIMEDI